MRLLEASTWLSFGPTVPHVVHCLYPMPVAAPAQSRCLRGGPWRLLSLGRRTWCTKGAPLSEAVCSQAPAQWTCEAASLQDPRWLLQEQQEPHSHLSRETLVCVHLGRQDAACVRGCEDKPGAEGELLLAPVCLVRALSEL